MIFNNEDSSRLLPRPALIGLDEIVCDFADTLVRIDRCGIPFKNFHVGVGPYGEPQLVREVVRRLREERKYYEKLATRRSPDLLVENDWAIEVKLARPFGDNGKLAENWSVNLLHPYEGNVSAIGDALKLLTLTGSERRAILVIGYEHMPPRVSLEPLLCSFELLAAEVAHIDLGVRVETRRTDLVHPVHQQLRVAAWEVRGRLS